MILDLISLILGILFLGVSAIHPNLISAVLSTVFLIIFYVGIEKRET